jgi:hypothetical protein
MPVNEMMVMKAMPFPSNLLKGSPILLLLLMEMMKKIWLECEEYIRESTELLNLRRARNPGNFFSSFLKTNLSSD